MASGRHYDQDKDSTLYVGNLDERGTDALVWELMLQAGPVVNVHLPKDRVTQTHQGYGFVEFASEVDAEYAAKTMQAIRLYGKPLRINKASADKRGTGPGGTADGEGQGVGAELFVGNLDAMVDEKVLFETFSRFGPLVAPPKISRDDATNLSKGFGFISYASFEASDDAIANMHGQYLNNKEVIVQYAFKKDGKGERHGDAAERALAAQAKKHGVQVAIPAMPAALVGMSNGMPYSQASMNGVSPFAAARPPQPPPAYNYGAYNPYNAMPPPQMQGAPGFPPPQFQGANSIPVGRARNYNRSPLQAPPMSAGLPAHPFRSTVGAGGPPPGFPPQAPPPGLTQHYPQSQQSQ